jgi:hypothetical protein
MKTTKSIFGTMAMSIVAMFLTANLFADVYLYVRPLEASKKALVELSIPIRNEVSIYVFDNKGELIHHENIKKGSSYKRIYDFSEVETGRYTIISDSKYLKVTKKINVNENSIDVVSTEYVHRPVFTVKDDVLSINYLNTTQSDVKISIEDSDKIYYKGNMSSGAVFKKSFDLKKLLPGKYTVLCEVDGYKFAYDIRKE